MAETGWETQGACHGHDLALWFPAKAAGQDSTGTEAKRICAGCPVRTVCLEAALERREEHGIWGGAGESLRRWLGRARQLGGDTWVQALAWHLADLDTHTTPTAATSGRGRPVDRNGPAATHGVRATYNRGCRCRACRWAAADDVHATTHPRPLQAS